MAIFYTRAQNSPWPLGNPEMLGSLPVFYYRGRNTTDVVTARTAINGS